jgi:hypothetical protein
VPSKPLFGQTTHVRICRVWGNPSQVEALPNGDRNHRRGNEQRRRLSSDLLKLLSGRRRDEPFSPATCQAFRETSPDRAGHRDGDVVLPILFRGGLPGPKPLRRLRTNGARHVVLAGPPCPWHQPPPFANLAAPSSCRREDDPRSSYDRGPTSPSCPSAVWPSPRPARSGRTNMSPSWTTYGDPVRNASSHGR